MAAPKRFNVRVYGLWLQDGQVLVSEELIKSRFFFKFPGGGLEFGEGMIDCLKREWMEELGLHIEIIRHYYTTDFFQPSAFDDSQVISIYYLVKPELPNGYVFPENGTERFLFMPADDLLASRISLPIDKKVAEMLAAGES
jgi:8-oxo-dGTP pyrophosphatase MutT (NUDIX family)